jgi:hypothetical protein
MKIKEVKQVIDKFKKKMKEKKDKKKRLSAIPPKPKTEKTDEALFSAFFIAFKNVLAIVELDENCSFADVKRAYKKCVESIILIDIWSWPNQTGRREKICLRVIRRLTT